MRRPRLGGDEARHKLKCCHSLLTYSGNGITVFTPGEAVPNAH
jgi:hypothetical protein